MGKGAVTKEAHDQNLFEGKSFWQRNFHDHIIRSDISHFFIARYITLNPLFWYLDSENPTVDSSSIDEFKEMLKNNDWFTEQEIDYLIEYEIEYRNTNTSL